MVLLSLNQAFCVSRELKATKLLFNLVIILFRTKFGIVLRTTGENPAAASNQGENVKQIRYISVIFGGAMAGLGGAYLSLVW